MKAKDRERGTGQSRDSKSVVLSYPHTVEIRERNLYIAALNNGDLDNFFGAVISTEPVEQIITVPHPDPSPPGQALLEVSLLGVTKANHQVKVLLNDTELMQMGYGRWEANVLKAAFAQSMLLEGDNVVTLVAQGDSDDVSVVNFIRLTYWRTYTAEQDTLTYTVPSGHQVVLGGFSSPLIRVVDITDPRQVQEVTGGIEPEGLGYAIRLGTSGRETRSFLAFTEKTVKRPATLTANIPSAWNGRGNGADGVIIAHVNFLESLPPLVALRESQEMVMALIDVENLYDEFAFGIKTLQAIRDFLAHATSAWQRKPRFVLLVGDASFDPRDYFGMGDYDLVPTKLIDTQYMETASDDWFADFNGDGLPELAVGRFPVRTAEEAARIVAKIVAYEKGPVTPASEVLLVADRNEGFDFEGTSDGVKVGKPVQVGSWGKG